MYSCVQYRVGADLGLHYVKCPNVPFRATLAIYEIFHRMMALFSLFQSRVKALEFHPSAQVALTGGMNNTLTLFQVGCFCFIVLQALCILYTEKGHRIRKLQKI